MRPDRVVLFQPMIDDRPGLRHRAEPISIQAGRPQDRVEAFVVRVLPRAPRFDVVRVYVPVLEPVLHVP